MQAESEYIQTFKKKLMELKPIMPKEAEQTIELDSNNRKEPNDQENKNDS